MAAPQDAIPKTSKQKKELRLRRLTSVRLRRCIFDLPRSTLNDQDDGQTLGELQSAGKRALCRWRCAISPGRRFPWQLRQIGMPSFRQALLCIMGETLMVLRLAMNIRSFVRVGLTLVAVALAGSAWSQQSAPRVALIIGNARYPEAGTPLPT